MRLVKAILVKAIQIFVLIIMLVAIAWFIYLVSGLVYEADQRTKIAFLTVVGSVLAVIITQILTNKRERESRLFENKAEAYKRVYSLIFSIIKQINEGSLSTNSEEPDPELVRMMQDARMNLMIWASSKTIDSWKSFYEICQTSSDDVEKVMKGLDKLFKDMRNDLGHNDGNKNELWLVEVIMYETLKKKLSLN